MRALVQRVAWAKVEVGGDVQGAIAKGLLVFVGVREGDHEAAADKLAGKLVRLRVFEDEAGKMNLDIRRAGGAFLVVSQFTLYAEVRRGNRPSFGRGGEPERARALYQRVVARLGDDGLEVATGVFGARMAVTLQNDGPVTLLLDSDALSLSA